MGGIVAVGLDVSVGFVVRRISAGLCLSLLSGEQSRAPACLSLLLLELLHCG